jgi:tRNA-splicing ligase RtcB
MGRITRVFGQHDEKTLIQLEDVATRAEAAALMADGHLGYVMPIGGVAAYDDKVSVVGVGFDIACGNAAIRTNLRADRFGRDEWEHLADEIAGTVSFGVGRSNKADDAPDDHPLFTSDAWSLLPKDANAKQLIAKARAQLGTVGSGNHYVDVFTDEQGDVWVGVHFGSRGLGYTIASGFLAVSQGKKWGERAPERETLLDLKTPLGDDYWQLMSLAGEYAYAGREWVARKVVDILGGEERELVHNHHNFAWREQQVIDGAPREVVIVRKGATPAFPGQKGFIGGSMGDDAVIVQGSASNDEEQVRAMYSTVHGAGRVMSRTQAAGKTKGWGAKKRVVSPGLISAEMLKTWVIDRKRVILRGGGLDEAPQAYRRLPDVLAAQGSTIDVLHTLTPIVVVMAGADEYDPYKD